LLQAAAKRQVAKVRIEKFFITRLLPCKLIGGLISSYRSCVNHCIIPVKKFCPPLFAPALNCARNFLQSKFANKAILFTFTTLIAFKKNIISYCFLCITAMPVIFATYYSVSKFIIRCSMKEKLEEGALVTIQVPLTHMVWTDEGEEAMLDGRMFDVKAYKISGNKITLTGLFDGTEDQLTAQLDKLLDKTNGTADNNELFAKWLACFVYSAGMQSTYFVHAQPQSLMYCMAAAEKLCNAWPSKQFHPPRRAFS
jgi:hypothetical protein